MELLEFFEFEPFFLLDDEDEDEDFDFLSEELLDPPPPPPPTLVCKLSSTMSFPPNPVLILIISKLSIAKPLFFKTFGGV
ncbi:unnamed protein product [[Candida] boidinii]|nr:unnamed protein product [[Candida] boidinii]